MTPVDVPRVRLLAKLLRELVSTSAASDTWPDLVEGLKIQCARLRIAWTPDAITAAVRLIASNVDLAGRPVARPRRAVGGDAAAISRTEAAAILARLGIRL